MKVWEFLVMLDEKRDANDMITAPAEILLGPEVLLAKDQTQATTLATRKIKEDVFADQEKLDRLVVVVRPF